MPEGNIRMLLPRGCLKGVCAFSVTLMWLMSIWCAFTQRCDSELGSSVWWSLRRFLVKAVTLPAILTDASPSRLPYCMIGKYICCLSKEKTQGKRFNHTVCPDGPKDHPASSYRSATCFPCTVSFLGVCPTPNSPGRVWAGAGEWILFSQLAWLFWSKTCAKELRNLPVPVRSPSWGKEEWKQLWATAPTYGSDRQNLNFGHRLQ